MFADYTKARTDECLLSVLKVENMNVYWVYSN